MDFAFILNAFVHKYFMEKLPIRIPCVILFVLDPVTVCPVEPRTVPDGTG